MTKPALLAIPPTEEASSLRAYLVAACAAEPELLATVALAEGEVELLHVVRDFRDNLPDRELRRRHGEASTNDSA